MNISVIVPCYKRIEQTLYSLGLILKSSGVGSEFSLELIVADSTPDDTLKQAVTKAYPSVVYVRPATSGIAANKNIGAKTASHKILIFCDSDMEVEPDTLKHTIESLKKHDQAAAIGGQVIWKGGPQSGQSDRPRAEDRQKDIAGTVFAEAIYSRYMATYKDVFWAVGGYDEEIFGMRGEGSDLSIRYWRAGYPLVFDSFIVVHHVHDVPDAAAVRTQGTKEGIAKDLVLLSSKYGMIGGGYHNFVHTIEANFGEGVGIAQLEEMPGVKEVVIEKKSAIESFRANDRPAYDMKFLEVFSNAEVLERCISQSRDRLKEIRQSAFV